MPWWVCLWVWLSTGFVCLFDTTEYCKHIVWAEAFSWFQDASSFPHNTLSHEEMQKWGAWLCAAPACIPTNTCAEEMTVLLFHNSGLLRFFFKTQQITWLPQGWWRIRQGGLPSTRHLCTQWDNETISQSRDKKLTCVMSSWCLWAAVNYTMNLGIMSQSSKQDPKFR